MNPGPTHPDLLPYVAGLPDPRAAADIEVHLERCPECSAETAALHSLQRSLLARHRSEHVPVEALVDHDEDGLDCDPQSRSRIDDHLGRCAECRADLEVLSRARRFREAGVALRRLSDPIAGGAMSRSRGRAWWAIGGVAAVVLVGIGLVALRQIGPGRPAAPPSVASVIFNPPRRGDAEDRVLSAGMPTALRVVLPFGSAGGAYRLTIERADGTTERRIEMPIPSAGEFLALNLRAPSEAGAYRLVLAPEGPSTDQPCVYPFRVVAPGQRPTED